MAAIVTLTMNPALDIATATERVVPGHKLRCDSPRYDPGGGGINVARVAHALGVDSFAVFPSGGSAGEMIGKLLRDEGVAHEAVPIVGFTRESLAVDEQCSGKQYRFLLPGPPIGEADQERCLERLTPVLSAAAYVVASGSLPPGVPADFYARVADLARAHRRPFVLDASGPGLKQAGGGIHLLKPSLRELEELTGREIGTEAEEAEAARVLVENGRCEIVVLSLGGRGSLLVTGTETARFPAIRVNARSTVGAGDSMLAGILVGLVRGRPLRSAVQFGMAAGAAALLGSGTQLCQRADVERLYEIECRGGTSAFS